MYHYFMVNLKRFIWSFFSLKVMCFDVAGQQFVLHWLMKDLKRKSVALLLRDINIIN